MKDRSNRLRIAGRGLLCPLALGFAFGSIPAASDAGILRDVMTSLHMSKPAPAKPGTPGAELPRQGFTCCNLHYSKDWINDGNYAELPMIPVGTPMELLSYGRNRAYVKIDGKPMRLGHDYGRDQESLEAWVAKVVVADDPRPRIAGYSPAVQEAIRLGKVMVGMTREQAIVAVGYPMTSETFSLDAPVWKIWQSGSGEYALNFRSDGRIESITGEDSVTSLAVYKPPADTQSRSVKQAKK